MGFYFSKDALAIFGDHVCTAGRKNHQTGVPQMAAGFQLKCATVWCYWQAWIVATPGPSGEEMRDAAVR
jgi:hypothetical protein